MKTSKIILGFLITLPLFLTLSIPSYAADGLADGIDIEGGKGWRIEESSNDDGTWKWEGGGKSGTAGSRKEAKQAARKAKRAAKKDGFMIGPDGQGDLR